jgi:hypothetical protein
MNTALTRAPDSGLQLTSLDDLFRLANALAQSGCFSDARGAAQAIVKILAGRELGIGPVASMTGIHIIEGKPSPGSHILAAAIRRSGVYDYEIIEHTDQVCAVRFLRRTAEGTWQEQGVERITLQEAIEKGWHLTAGGKVKGPWQKTPKNLLFARVMTNGYKFHCPDVASGMLLYDADELDAGTPSAPTQPLPAGEMIDASYTVNGNYVDQNAPPAADDPALETREPDPRQQALATTEAARQERYGGSDPNAQLPAPAQETPATITPQEYEELVSLIRQRGWKVGDVRVLLGSAGVPTLERLPPSWLERAKAIVAQDWATNEQTDRIAHLITASGIRWEDATSRLRRKFGVTSFAHLTRVEADSIIQAFEKKPAA